MDRLVEAKIKLFFSRYPVKRLSKGELLIWPDQNLEDVYYLQKGRVRQFDIIENGTKVTVNIFITPAFFPMNLAINKIPSRYFFEAIDDAEVRYAPVEDVLAFLRQNPAIMIDLLGRVFRGIEGILQKMTYMMANDSEKRIIFELVTECKRADKDAGSHLIKLSESDLGTHIGLTRETVNRYLAKLKAAGLISVTNEGIQVHDVSKLEEMLA